MSHWKWSSRNDYCSISDRTLFNQRIAQILIWGILFQIFSSSCCSWCNGSSTTSKFGNFFINLFFNKNFNLFSLLVPFTAKLLDITIMPVDMKMSSWRILKESWTLSPPLLLHLSRLSHKQYFCLIFLMPECLILRFMIIEKKHSENSRKPFT